MMDDEALKVHETEIEMIEILHAYEDAKKSWSNESEQEQRFEPKEVIEATVKDIIVEQIVSKLNTDNTLNNNYRVGDIVAIKHTKHGHRLKLKIKFVGPYKITEVKCNDRFDVEKIGDSVNTYNITGIAADSMIRWPLRFNEDWDMDYENDMDIL